MIPTQGMRTILQLKVEKEPVEKIMRKSFKVNRFDRILPQFAMQCVLNNEQ